LLAKALGFPFLRKAPVRARALRKMTAPSACDAHRTLVRVRRSRAGECCVASSKTTLRLDAGRWTSGQSRLGRGRWGQTEARGPERTLLEAIGSAAFLVAMLGCVWFVVKDEVIARWVV